MIRLRKGTFTMGYVTDDRQYLQEFCSGESCSSYEYLGVHKADDGSCYVFRVWAPSALSVSVVGAFNDWDENANRMSRIGNGGIWECYINGLNEFDAYKYCIVAQNYERLYKSDPYGFHFETRPKNATKFYKCPEMAWEDDSWIKFQSNSNHLKLPMNIYEVHMGSWKKYPDGNFFSYVKFASLHTYHLFCVCFFLIFLETFVLATIV